MPARISLSQPLGAQIHGHIVRTGFPPSIVVASGDDSLRVMLCGRLRDRGCDVLEVRDAATFHALVVEGTSCDLFLLDESLEGCSPLHGFGYARRHGLRAPAIAVVRIEDDHARTEARRLELLLSSRSVVLGSLDRLLLTALRCIERPSRAA